MLKWLDIFLKASLNLILKVNKFQNEFMKTSFLPKYEQTSPKGFSASKCDVGDWIFSKSYEFFENLFGNFLDFLGEFFGNFL